MFEMWPSPAQSHRARYLFLHLLLPKLTEKFALWPQLQEGDYRAVWSIVRPPRTTPLNSKGPVDQNR